jgi:RHS repeat-associated protein
VVTEVSSAGVWNRGEVYAGGRQLATYANGTTYFAHADWLGTHRVRTGVSGSVAESYQSLPFGDGMTPSTVGVSPNHFTGKERDAESGLDDFPARYFTSSMGRWMTPDIMGGHADDPQTLNKYAYARNNPVSLTDPTGLDSYLSCTHTDQNGSTCQQQTVGYDKDGNAQKAWVQGQTGDNGKFTATLIGNDAKGNLVDKTTGTGSYTASVNGSGVEFSNNGGQTSSSGVFVNGTPQTTFQDAGWANGNALSGFTFTLTNSKLEAGQTEAGTFFGIGGKDQVERAIEAAGFKYHLLGLDRHFDEYRSPGDPNTGANSGHFNVSQLHQNPKVGVPITPGNMHFGEHNPFTSPLQHLEEQK